MKKGTRPLGFCLFGLHYAWSFRCFRHYIPTLVDGKLGAENGYLGRRFWRPFYRDLSHH
jgi:hypothetical protein